MKAYWQRFRQEWSQPENRSALWTSAALVTSLFAPGIAVYLRNSGEFVFRLSSILGVMIGIAIVMIWGLARLQLCFRRRGFLWGNVLMLALALMEWIQWTLLGRNIGVLRGSMIDWSDYSIFMWWESGLLLLILAICLIFRRAVARFAMKLSLLCILGQLLPQAWESVFWEDPGYLHRDYRLTEDRKFEFGSRNNVLLIVTDAVGRQGLRQAFARYPDLSETFRDFHCFRDMISPMPRTAFAIPAMLTGRVYPDWNQDLMDENLHADFLKQSYFDPNSLLLQLRAAGYETEGYPFTVQTLWYDPALLNNLENAGSRKVTSLIPWFDLWLFRMVPLVLKPFVINDSQWLFRQFVPAETHDGLSDLREWDLVFHQGVINNYRVGERSDVFKYLHLQGGHVPLEITANCEPVREAGNVDMIDQVAGCYRIIGQLLEKMRRSGVYDQAMIVVTSDHTESYTGEVSTLIKCPGDNSDFLRYHDTPGQVNEIAATIRRIMLPGDAPAEETRSLFDPPSADRLQSADWVMNECELEPFFPASAPVFPEAQYGNDFWSFVCYPRGDKVVFHDQGAEISNKITKGGRIFFVLSDPVSGADRYVSVLSSREMKEDTGVELTLDFDGVKDGAYTMRYVYEPEGEEWKTPIAFFCSWFPVIRDGKLLPGVLPEIPPGNLRCGEKVLFQPGRIYPFCRFQNCKTQADGVVIFTEKSRMEISLEPGKTGKLLLEFHLAALNVNAVEIYHKDTLLGHCKTQKDVYQYIIPIPITPNRHKLHLRVRFQSGPLPFKRHRISLAGMEYLPDPNQ